MKITNTTGLPDIILEWAQNDSYKRGIADYTTTELIKPPRILQLERRHKDEIEVDVTDLIWRLSGQAKHVIFQRVAENNPDRYVAEERFTLAVAGVVISGQLDLYDRENATLYDYKECKTYKGVLGDYKDWTQQANINAFLCYHVGNFPVKALRNIAVFKDWTIRASKADHNYPQSPIQEVRLELWDYHKTLQFIQKRVSLHNAAAGAAELPLCTAEERWQRPSRWAVMKSGRKTAIKLFDTRQDAAAFVMAASDRAQLSVVMRSSEDTRCLYYCDVANFCDYGRKVKADSNTL